MRCETLDKEFFAEIRDLNVAFLDLVADPRAGGAGLDMLGITPRSAAALAALGAAERRRIAAVPVPLAGFRRLPMVPRVAESPLAPSGLEPAWELAASLFAAGLLTYLWQLARRLPLAAALCVGPADDRVEQLAALSFDAIQACALAAAPLLEARPAFSPALLPGLVRAARREGPEDGAVGLELIPLGLAGLRPARARRRRL